MTRSILDGELKPVEGRELHLRETTDEAFGIEKRKSKNPIVSIVNAEEDFQKGIRFYDMDLVNLKEGVAPQCILLPDQWQI